MTIPSARALHRVLIRVTQASAAVFAWIFVFQYFYVRTGGMAEAIVSVALTYALAQVTTVLLTPWAASKIRHGFRRMLVYAALLLATSYVVLAASFAGYLGGFGWGVGLFAVLFGAYRALYWVPYEISRVTSPVHGFRPLEILVALSPAVAGLLLTTSSIAPIGLLCAASVLAVISIFPIAGMREVHEGFMWTYRETFHEFFAYTRRRISASSIADGIEAGALLLFWPLVIFILLSWSYPMLGIVLSATFLFTLVLRHFLYRPLSRISAPMSAVLAASAWVIRLTVGGAFGVILVDTYFYVGSRSKSRGIDMGTFEQAADSSTFVDEHTALKEMGMAMGRILLCLLVAALASITTVPISFAIAFICAGTAAAYSVYMSHSPVAQA